MPSPALTALDRRLHILAQSWPGDLGVHGQLETAVAVNVFGELDLLTFEFVGDQIGETAAGAADCPPPQSVSAAAAAPAASLLYAATTPPSTTSRT